MTFLNPFVLFGLAAAAIPILIHLFNIRKLRTIEFSTLTFLKELNKNKIRKIKIRQWLLLALRTLLILLIILAFSRPALKGNFGIAGSRASSTLVMVLDNTASMDRHNERGKFLLQARQKALEILGTLQENDELYVLRLSDLPLATTEEATRDAGRMAALIRDTEISAGHRTVEEGLRLASRLLQQSKNFNKEVFVFTDGQSSPAPDGSISGGEKLFEPQVKIFYTALAQRQQENIAVENASILPSLLQVNKPFTLQVVLRNYGSARVNNHLVTVSLDRSRVMQKGISLEGGESATLEFPLIPNRAGFLSGTVESEDDAFEPDNRWFFAVNIPENISVALVAQDPRYSRYIAAALNTAGSISTSAPITVTNLAPSKITSALLSSSDVVILSGITDLTASQSDMLRQYVTNGGSAIFFPAADSSSVDYRYLSPFGLDGFRYSRSAASFQTVDLQFPVFQGMYDPRSTKKEASVESPSIVRSLHPAVEANIRSIITLTNGRSFFWMRETGRGKIIGAALPATTEWSDFPLRGLFVPLLFQSVLYLASPVNTADEWKFTAGAPVEFSSALLKRRSTASLSALQCFDPESRNVPLQSYVKAGSEGISHSIVMFKRADQAGMYAVRSQSDTVLALPVNISRNESRTDIAEEEQLTEMMERLGIDPAAFSVLTPQSDIGQAATESRYGIELWRYFLFAALAVALTEMIIAREPKQKMAK